MSYILDALKKAEEERRRGEVPGIDVLHEPAAEPGRRRAVIILAAAAVSLLPAGLFLARDRRQTVEIPAPARPAGPMPVAVMRIVRPVLPVPAAAVPAGPREPAQPPAAAPAPGAAAAPAPQTLAALPAAVRDSLPAVTISAHFYTDDPAARMASVNGRLVHEGDRVDGMTVREIVPDGVVFEAGGRVFTVPVQ